MSGLEEGYDAFADAYWNHGVAESGEAAEGFGCELGVAFELGLDFEAGDAALVGFGHEGAEGVFLVLALHGHLEGLDGTDGDGESAGLGEGSFVVLEHAGFGKLSGEAAAFLDVRFRSGDFCSVKLHRVCGVITQGTGSESNVARRERVNLRLDLIRIRLGDFHILSDNPRMNNERKILIAGIHMDLTDAIRNSAEEQLCKLFDHDPSILRIRLELELDAHAKTHKDEFAAKGHVELKGDVLVATVRGDDLYLCIRDLEQKLDRMLRKRANRRLDKRNHPHAVDLDIGLPKAV